MTTAQREFQIVAGSAWLESCNGCGCPDCAAHRPRILSTLLKLRGIELVEIEADFEPSGRAGRDQSLNRTLIEPSGPRPA